MVSVKNWLHTAAAVMTSLPTWLPLLLDFSKQDLFVKTRQEKLFLGGEGGSSYMVLQNRLGMGGGTFFNFS